MRLYAARYAGLTDAEYASDTIPDQLEFIHDPANIGIRWSLPGGVQRIEVTVYCRNMTEVYRRYRDHLDQRLAIVDNLLDRPVASGWIKEVRPGINVVTYIATGSWKEHSRELEDRTAGIGETMSAYIKTMLTAHVDRISSDQGNIGANNTNIGSWAPAGDGGSYPDAIIEEFLQYYDGSGNLWDYWLQEAPLQMGRIQLPIPHFVARSDTGDPDFIVQRGDFSADGLEQSRHIYDYADQVLAYYGSTPSSAGGTSAAETKYGSRTKRQLLANASLTQAENHEAGEVKIFADATQQQAFTISAPRLTTAAGAARPLWQVIKDGGGYIRAIIDPDLSLYSTRQDRAQSFRISAADYDYVTNTLRLVPERPDMRIDAVLKRSAGVLEATGEGISRKEDPRLIGPPERRGKLKESNQR